MPVESFSWDSTFEGYMMFRLSSPYAEISEGWLESQAETEDHPGDVLE